MAGKVKSIFRSGDKFRVLSPTIIEVREVSRGRVELVLIDPRGERVQFHREGRPAIISTKTIDHK